jgi:hypothetical protein
MRRLSAALVMALGCGLISDDVARFDLRFPAKAFRVDTADWQVVGVDRVPTVACSQGCVESREALCGGSTCTVDCDGATSTCQLHVNVSLYNNFDLAAEAPEYQRLADQPFLSVTIDEVFFQIDENTLNLPTPPLAVYMGPQSITGPQDTGAQLVGTIAALPPGMTGRVDIAFDAAGRAAMKRYLDDFHTPFRVLVHGQVTVRGGDPRPAGRLVGAVQAHAHVGL